MPLLQQLTEVIRITTELIRAEPLYAVPGYMNTRARLQPEAFAADVAAARARLGLPPRHAAVTTDA